MRLRKIICEKFLDTHNNAAPDDYKICLSEALHEYESQEYFDLHFGSIAGQKIIMPIEHSPNPDFLAYHRDHIFLH